MSKKETVCKGVLHKIWGLPIFKNPLDGKYYVINRRHSTQAGRYLKASSEPIEIKPPDVEEARDILNKYFPFAAMTGRVCAICKWPDNEYHERIYRRGHILICKRCYPRFIEMIEWENDMMWAY